MSREREIVNNTSSTNPIEQLARKDIKARLVQVLERGVVGDRLAVELPPDVYGEWVPNDKIEIYRMQSLGFQVDTTYAKARALHDGGDGASYVGDTVFMTCPREIKDIIDEIRREQYEEANSPKRIHKEEREFSLASDKEGLPAVNKSSTVAVDKDQIKAALTS